MGCIFEIRHEYFTLQVGCRVPPAYSLWGNCFIYVYSITDYTSFQELPRIKQEVDKLRCGNTSCVTLLVGNQSDLYQNRQVPTVDALKLAEMWDCEFCELSACDADGIEDIKNVFHSAYWHHCQSNLEIDNRKQQTLSLPHPLPLMRFRRAISKVIAGCRSLRSNKLARSRSNTPDRGHSTRVVTNS